MNKIINSKFNFKLILLIFVNKFGIKTTDIIQKKIKIYSNKKFVRLYSNLLSKKENKIKIQMERKKLSLNFILNLKLK